LRVRGPSSRARIVSASRFGTGRLTAYVELVTPYTRA